MDQNFYNLLYNGYTGEFQLIGALYRNGLDALRPPADMGVDVVTVNLKAQLQDPSVQPETLMFQVKTAVVTVQEAGGGRARLYDGVLHAEGKRSRHAVRSANPRARVLRL